MTVFRCYKEKKFNAQATTLLGHINGIIERYEAKGYSLTVRQVYYQLVSGNLIENNTTSYTSIQKLISEGRLAGLVSWTAIEDRGRNLQGYRTFDSPGEAVESVRSEYKIDMWKNQRFRPEVWVEKAALEGVIARICGELRVDFYATRGYDSQSQSWRAGRRFADYVSRGQIPIVLHLGDHDPSGIDMTRDNQERLSMFAGFNVMVNRIALTMDQIRIYNPPPNPAKMTDARAKDYVENYGDESWELDALRPEVIHDLIRLEIMKLRDETAWAESLHEELEDKLVLQDVAETLS